MREIGFSAVWLVALALVASAFPTFAKGLDRYRDIDRLKFEALDISSPAPSGLISDIIQGPNGFIWFGTREGAHRFDGYEIRTYSNERGNPSSLVNSVALCFFVDDRQRIWIGTEKGVSYYVPETDSFRSFLLEPDEYNSNLANHVNAIVQHSGGPIYVSSESGYIYRFDAEATRFVRENQRRLGIIKSMVIDERGRLWTGADNRLSRFDPDTGETKVYSDAFSPDDPTMDNFIESICYLDEQTIWVATASDGAGVFNSVTGKLATYEYADEAERYAHLVYRDWKDNIWVGHSGGMTIFKNGGREVIRYTPEMEEGPLPASGIHSLLLDRQGNIWVGSAFHGMFLSTNGKKFKGLTEYVGRSESDRAVISSLMEDRRGNLWVGRNSTGIDIFPSDGSQVVRLRHDPSNPSSISLNTVFTIFEDSFGEIWVGTYRGGLHKYLPESRSFQKYLHVPGIPTSIAGNDVRAIQEDELGNLWVLTHGRGISYFDREANHFTNYRNDQDNADRSLIDDWSNALLYTSNGYLLVGTPIGLSVMESGSDEFENFVYDPNRPESLSNPVVNTIFEDTTGRIWVGTADGINLFDLDAKRFTSWSVEEGLPNRVVNSILEDVDGRLWIGTDNGLARFDPETYKVSTYDERDGITDNAFYARSAVRRSNNELYFGMMDGVTFFNPREIEDNTFVPTVWITDFKVFNRSLPVDPSRNDGGALQRSILKTDLLKLSHDQKVISIDFVALNYIQSSKNEYAYKLEGFDRNWNYVGTRREATYTNLNPGSYVFKVRASNNDGYWSEVPRELGIQILPPFWGTLWFRVGLGLALVMLPTLLVVWRMRVNRYQKLKLEETVAKRTKDLSEARDEIEQAYRQLERNQSKIQEQYEELVKHRENLESMVSRRTRELETAKEKAERSDRLKSAFLANMSHEIRTPMNAIIGLLDILQLENLSKEEKEQYTEVIKQSSSTLMTLIDDILDLSRIESGEARIHPQTINCDEICEELQALFSHVASRESGGAVALRLLRNGKEGIRHADRNDLLLPGFDPIRLKQVLTNLLSNAIKFTDKGEVRFGYDTELLSGRTAIRFFVEDTGIGIPSEQLARVFDRFHKVEAPDGRVYRGTGLGLTISKRLSELMGGVISVQSEQGTGTTFSIDFERRLESGFGPFEPRESGGPESAEDGAGGIGACLSGLRVLVAEDEVPNYLVLQKYLADSGCELVWVKDGEEAIRAFRERSFNVVLLDLKMPNTDGYDVLSYIRSVDTRIPVLVQSAYAMEQDETRAMSLGATGFLAKPFTKQSLLREIDSLLGPTRA